MKKIFFTLLFVLTLSLSALYIFDSKEVHAVEIDNEYYIYDVVFSLTDDQISKGVKWKDGSTSNIQAFFSVARSFYYFINTNTTSRNNLYVNSDYYGNLVDSNDYQTVNDQVYVEIVYNGQPTVFFTGGLKKVDWFLSLDRTKIDETVPFKVRYAFSFNMIGDCDFTYRIGATQNADGSFNYSYKTGNSFVLNIFSLGSISTIDYNVNLRPGSFGDELFVGWSIDNQIYTYYDLFDFYFTSSFDAIAVYSNQSTYVVNFYDGFNLLASQTFFGGYGTITPPDVSLGVGQKLLGWSLKLGGFIIDLENFYLVEDTDLYVVKEFSSDSTVNGGSFELEYSDCGNFDIPCHLGNAFIYFLNEFPLVSDVVSFIYPISDLLEQFPAIFEVLESFGYIFYIVIGILFVTLVFRLFR